MLIEFHRRMLADEVRSAAFEAALKRVIIPGETTVADIGAGTGVLGFMAQRLGAREVHLIEHGPAMELAARLAEANRIAGLHFWQAHSGELINPPLVDVVVAEVLGNLALEENALETLADARRFLKEGGTLIPKRVEQFAAPLISDRFWRELHSWDRAPLKLDFSAARSMSFDNVYVQRIGPGDLLPGADTPRCWDELDFLAGVAARRHGAANWNFERPAKVFGLALWWRCELVPGVDLATGPFSAPTHWDQVYAPVAEPIEALAGDSLVASLEFETGGGEPGVCMRWELRHLRGDREISRQAHDIGRGYLG